MKKVKVLKQPKPVPVVHTAGYPVKDIKTTGIKIRGTGAATKGVIVEILNLKTKKENQWLGRT